MKVVIAERISDAGVALLQESRDFEVVGAAGPRELLAQRLADADGLIVREGTRVDAALLEHAPRLRVIARAGAAAENVDVEAATRRGIAVFAMADGGTVSAAEHAIALMACLARRVCQADRALKAGRVDEGALVGVELRGKVLGLVGLGHVGQEVARRALGLGLKVLGHDPFLKEGRARELEVEPCELDDLLARSDFVSLHAAVTAATRHLLDARRLGLLRRGAYLVNCADSELVDERALLEALESGRLAGAALDTFTPDSARDSPLARRSDVIATPRLSASTAEAQAEVGRRAAEQVRDFLLHGTMDGAVNFPAIPPDRRQEALALMDLAERTGRFLSAITDGAPERVEISLVKPLHGVPREAVSAAAVRGILSTSLGSVALVNALSEARGRGVEISERAGGAEPEPGATLQLRLATSQRERSVVSTLHGHRRRLLAIDDAPVESELAGHLLLFRNRDVPGVLGRVGSVLGSAGSNIASIHVGRPDAGQGVAVGVVTLDEAPSPDALARLRELPEILEVRSVCI